MTLGARGLSLRPVPALQITSVLGAIVLFLLFLFLFNVPVPILRCSTAEPETSAGVTYLGSHLSHTNGFSILGCSCRSSDFFGGVMSRMCGGELPSRDNYQPGTAGSWQITTRLSYSLGGTIRDVFYRAPQRSPPAYISLL